VSIYATEYAISERTAAYPLKKLSLKAFWYISVMLQQRHSVLTISKIMYQTSNVKTPTTVYFQRERWRCKLHTLNSMTSDRSRCHFHLHTSSVFNKNCYYSKTIHVHEFCIWLNTGVHIAHCQILWYKDLKFKTGILNPWATWPSKCVLCGPHIFLRPSVLTWYQRTHLDYVVTIWQSVLLSADVQLNEAFQVKK
jgi:hypothetical protein